MKIPLTCIVLDLDQDCKGFRDEILGLNESIGTIFQDKIDDFTHSWHLLVIKNQDTVGSQQQIGVEKIEQRVIKRMHSVNQYQLEPLLGLN